jgi:hypothetical protein
MSFFIGLSMSQATAAKPAMTRATPASDNGFMEFDSFKKWRISDNRRRRIPAAAW